VTDAGRTQVPLGFVADRVGGPRVMLASLVAWSAVARPRRWSARRLQSPCSRCWSARAPRWASRSPASCPPPPPWPPSTRPGPPQPRSRPRSMAALGPRAVLPHACHLHHGRPLRARGRRGRAPASAPLQRWASCRPAVLSLLLIGMPTFGPRPVSSWAGALEGACPAQRARPCPARRGQVGTARRARAGAGGHLRGSVCGHGGGHAADTAAAVARRPTRLLGRGSGMGGAPLSGSALPALDAGTHARTAASLFCRKAGAGGAPLARCLRCHVPGARRPRSKRLHDAPVHPCRLGCGGKMMLAVLQGAWATVGSHIGLAAGAWCVPCELRCARTRCGEQALWEQSAWRASRICYIMQAHSHLAC